MKVKLLTIGVMPAAGYAYATLVLGGVIGSLHAKSATVNITVGQMCPD